MKCPLCKGKGFVIEEIPVNSRVEKKPRLCPQCGGRGEL